MELQNGSILSTYYRRSARSQRIAPIGKTCKIHKGEIVDHPSLRKLAIVSAFIMSGCAVTLDPTIPKGSFPGDAVTVSDVASGVRPTVSVSQAASGTPSPIGHGTISVFAIKVAPVRIANGSGDQVLMDIFKRALQENGYQVADAKASEALPVVECTVQKFRFQNYTWFVPIVPTWGGIDLEVRVASRDGKALWTKSYSGGSWNLWYSFNSAVNRAMEKILEQAVADFGSSSFREACCLGASGA